MKSAKLHGPGGPISGFQIMPRVDRLPDGSFVTLVRRVMLDNGYIVAKDLLLPNGEWARVPEGGTFLKETFLKSSFLDRKDLDQRVYNWPR